MVVRAPGRVWRASGTCPELLGPYPRSVKIPTVGSGLKGFSPGADVPFWGWCPMDRMGSYGHQGGPEVPLASSRALFGPIGGRLKNQLLDMGLNGCRAFPPMSGQRHIGHTLQKRVSNSPLASSRGGYQCRTCTRRCQPRSSELKRECTCVRFGVRAVGPGANGSCARTGPSQFHGVK